MSLELATISEFYHGSPEEVTFPDVYHNRTNRDFGRGFYLFAHREMMLTSGRSTKEELSEARMPLSIVT